MTRTLLVYSVFVLFVLLGSTANTRSVVITSTQFTAGGSWSERWWSFQDGVIHQTAGNFSSTHSTSATDTFKSSPNKFNQAEVSFAPFSLLIKADAAPWADFDEGIVTGGGIYIGAWSTMNFRPETTHLVASLSVFSSYNYYSYEQDIGFTLKDLTTSTLLADLQNMDDDNVFLRTLDLTVDPLHEYSLTFSAGINAWDFKEASMNAKVTFNSPVHPSVPDTAATLPLLLLALLPVGLLRAFHHQP
jgi:hypothetical protein